MNFLFEEEKVGMGKKYQWKEALMSAVQDSLKERAEDFNTQEEYQQAVDEEIDKINQETKNAFEMIKRSLYQVPYKAFK